MSKIITIKSHQFENKNKIELSVVSGDYYCIGEVQCFSVYFLEYNTGSTYAIQISKLPNGKIVLTQDNGQEIVIHPEDVQDVIKFLQKFSK
jgi:hypothetical protein